MKVIGHQRVIQNLDSTESGLTSHHRAKFLGSDAPKAGSSKDKDPGNDSGNDVASDQMEPHAKWLLLLCLNYPAAIQRRNAAKIEVSSGSALPY
jgi:hypothetical protein